MGQGLWERASQAGTSVGDTPGSKDCMDKSEEAGMGSRVSAGQCVSMEGHKGDSSCQEGRGGVQGGQLKAIW